MNKDTSTLKLTFYWNISMKKIKICALGSLYNRPNLLQCEYLCIYKWLLSYKHIYIRSYFDLVSIPYSHPLFKVKGL